MQQVVVGEAGSEAGVLNAAQEEERRGDWRSAAARIQAYQASRPLSTEARAKLAYYLSRSEAYGEAVEVYRGLLAEKPGEAKWHYGLGYQFEMQERWREAIASYEQALEAAPRFLRVARRLGGAYLAAQQTEKALDTFRKGIKAYHDLDSRQRNERRDDHAKLCAAAGRCLLDGGGAGAAAAEALELFRDSVASDPTNADNLYRLGSLYLDKGEIDKAEECLVAANKLAPNKDYVIHRLAQAQLKKGTPAEALATYERIPNHRRAPYVLHGMAQCDIALGRIEDAARKLYRAIQREPEKFYHHWDLGLVLEQLGATKQALESFETGSCPTRC